MSIFDYADIYDDVELDDEFMGVDDTDWSESTCPVCNRLLDSHDTQRMTRCALTDFNT